MQCPLPQERCQGWEVALGASLCGHGYLQGSYLCTACARGSSLTTLAHAQRAQCWHLRGNATLGCFTSALPSSASSPLYMLILAIVVFCVGGTITGGLFRMSNLALWALMCAQVRSMSVQFYSAGCTTTRASPRLYRMLLLSSRLHCHPSLLLCTRLQLCCSCRVSFCPQLAPALSRLGQTYLQCRSPWVYGVYRSFSSMRRACHSLRLVGQFALMWAMVLYPSASLAATQLLRCQHVTLSALGAAGLDGGPTD